MSDQKAPVTLSVDGYEVSLSFADNINPAALGQVKQILLSSFVAHGPKAGDILAFPGEQRDNIDRENPLHLENSMTSSP